MAKMKFPGLDEYVTELEKLTNTSRECIGKAIYEGAAIVADAVKQATANLPIDERVVRNGQMLVGITQKQKDGLLEGFGIAPMENDNGYQHVKLGFDGYNTERRKNYPNGQPNSMIARSVNSGTSFSQRIPFVDNAIRQRKSACEEKMKETFDQELGKAVK